MRYLSEDWFSAANQAVQAAPPPAGRLVIDQHISDTDAWRIVIDTDSSIKRITTSDPSEHDCATDLVNPADAVFRQSRATAQAVATGETDAHQAFLLGDITFVGDIDVLIERRAAFTWLQEMLAPVMAETTWD